MVSIVAKNEQEALEICQKFLPKNPRLFVSPEGKRLAVWLVSSCGWGEFYTQRSLSRVKSKTFLHAFPLAEGRLDERYQSS